MNERKTKIVAKIADNRCDTAFLKSVFAAGADVAWLNTAHQGEAETIGVVKNIREVSTSMPIMIDTKGPEVRTKDVATPIEVKKGDHLILTGDASHKGPNVVLVTYPNFHNEVPVGEVVLYDDALIEMVVVEKLAKGIKVVINNPGLIKGKKSLNVPNVHINLPALSEKDKGFVHFCAEHNIDYIAHSFMRSKADIAEIKKITSQYPGYNVKIIAKIENREGFDNLREILKNCDGLMVARGDLGAEVGLENVPFMQKKMVEMCLEMGKYCIVATQALESMIKNPRPTRAEVSDVANAVLEGTGAMSMSGETAYGEYPIEATAMMGRIMKATETKRNDLQHFTMAPKNPGSEYAFAKTVIKKATGAKAKAIVAVGVDLKTLKALSAQRADINVAAFSSDEHDVRELGLAYGIRPVHAANPTVEHAAKALKDSFKPKDSVVVLTAAKKGIAVAVKPFSALSVAAKPAKKK